MSLLNNKVPDLSHALTQSVPKATTSISPSLLMSPTAMACSIPAWSAPLYGIYMEEPGTILPFSFIAKIFAMLVRFDETKISFSPSPSKSQITGEDDRL